MRFLPAVFLLVPASLLAWTPATEQRIAERALRLAPPDLRLVAEKFQPEFRKGIADAAAEEAGKSHRITDLSPTGVRAELEREIRESIQMIRKNEPMPRFVEKLGRIAHLTGDINNPFQSPSISSRLGVNRADFEAYLERKLSKIPTVFYGLEGLNETRPIVLASIARSGRFVPLLEEEYFRHGERRTSADFDDRSTGFGVAAISYSRSVSDLVNFYYYIWKEAGGDVRNADVMRKSNLLLHPSIDGN
jgi:hypothetical protein